MIFQLENDDFQANAVDERSYVERVGIAAADVDRLGQPVVDLQRVKLVTGVYPRIEAVSGTAISIYVEARMDSEETVSWQGPYTFTVGTDEKVNVYVTGRYIGVRFEATDDVEWALQSYSLELQKLGLR